MEIDSGREREDVATGRRLTLVRDRGRCDFDRWLGFWCLCGDNDG
jgi:hypothetical protein